MSTLDDILRTCAAGKRKEVSYAMIYYGCFKGEDWPQQVKRWAREHNLQVSFSDEFSTCTFYPPGPYRPTA